MRAAVVAVVMSVLVACGGKKESKPPPEKPFTGAPVAVVVDKINEDSVDVSVYNFGDEAVVSYWFLIRYKDADGKVLKVKPGTPFEKDYDFMTMSGNSYAVGPKAWTKLDIDMLEIPEGTKSAEVIVRSVGGASGDKPIWELDGHDWPAGN